MSLKAFEGDSLLGVEIARLVREFNIQSAIETGTEYGGTSIALSQMVSQVVTCDIEKRVSELPGNVKFILADSRTVLAYAIGVSTPPILFYLDAHTQDFSEPCPLTEELELIARYTVKYPPPVIVIHDCRVPDHPELGFATYKGVPISLESIHTQIVSIYPHGFRFHYNSEATGARRGVLFITPS